MRIINTRQIYDTLFLGVIEDLKTKYGIVVEEVNMDYRWVKINPDIGNTRGFCVELCRHCTKLEKAYREDCPK